MYRKGQAAIFTLDLGCFSGCGHREPGAVGKFFETRYHPVRRVQRIKSQQSLLLRAGQQFMGLNVVGPESFYRIHISPGIYFLCRTAQGDQDKQEKQHWSVHAQI